MPFFFYGGNMGSNFLGDTEENRIAALLDSRWLQGTERSEIWVHSWARLYTTLLDLALRSRPNTQHVFYVGEVNEWEQQGICFSLNPVGLKIWELLKKRHSVDQIADEMAQDFPVSRPRLFSDVVEFLHSLEAKHLIHRSHHTVATQSWLARIFPWAKQHVQPH
jgi:hypothetical protein